MEVKNGEHTQFLLLVSQGSETWKQGPESHSKDAWMHGGGSTWVVGSYDADLDVIY